MLSFKHPNVMSLIGLCLDGNVPLIIMPFMSDGSLMEYVRRNRQHLYFALQSSQDKVIFPHTCVHVWSKTVDADFVNISMVCV